MAEHLSTDGIAERTVIKKVLDSTETAEHLSPDSNIAEATVIVKKILEYTKDMSPTHMVAVQVCTFYYSSASRIVSLNWQV